MLLFMVYSYHEIIELAKPTVKWPNKNPTDTAAVIYSAGACSMTDTNETIIGSVLGAVQLKEDLLSLECNFDHILFYRRVKLMKDYPLVLTDLEDIRLSREAYIRLGLDRRREDPIYYEHFVLRGIPTDLKLSKYPRYLEEDNMKNIRGRNIRTAG